MTWRAWPADVLIEADGVTVTFPDVPEAITWGATKREALERASDALLSILTATAHDEPLPAASPANGRPLVWVYLLE